MIRVKFTELDCGDIFFAHHTFWVKTDPEAARSIHARDYGFCNFTIDSEDEYVEKVPGQTVLKMLKDFHESIS